MFGNTISSLPPAYEVRGKVLFSVPLFVQIGGGGVPIQLTGGYPIHLMGGGGYPHPADGDTPNWGNRGSSIQPRGVSPSGQQGGTPIQPIGGWGGTPIWLTGDTLPVGTGWGTPSGLVLPVRIGWGYPHVETGCGYFPIKTGPCQETLATWRAVCLLRSRRRTFLFIFDLFDNNCWEFN